MSFGENLRYALDLVGLKRVDLSRKTGISIKSIENYLKKNSSTLPTADYAVKMAQVLGVTVEYLVNGGDDKKKGVKIIQNRNSKIIPILDKLDKSNFEVINSMAKALLDLQVKKIIQKQL